MKQRITLYVDSEVWRMFRMLCLLDKTSASAAVERMMELAIGDTNLPELSGANVATKVANTPDDTPNKAE